MGIIAIVLFLADSGTMQMYLVFIVGMILMMVLLPALRPSREWNMLLQVIFAFLIIFIGFSALMVNMAEDSPAAKENTQVIENTYGTGELELTDELEGILEVPDAIQSFCLMVIPGQMTPMMKTRLSARYTSPLINGFWTESILYIQKKKGKSLQTQRHGRPSKKNRIGIKIIQL